MNPQQAFWQWFVAHQDELFNFEADQERIFDELHSSLNLVHPDLTFEFGPGENRREFVVSAGGLRRAFPAVSSLVAEAPKLERWQVTAFRPRRAQLCRVELGERCVNPEDVEFTLLTKDSTIGLRLFIPGINEDDLTLKQIVYLMLDEALGEYDVETKVGLIQMLPPESPHTGERYPLPDLPSRFDQLASELAGTASPN
jgi:hypothetical protein